ncbi:carbohydrate ABC transporter permease [Jeotgalibacillus campisalis]|uniref:ABC transmembrane type-1 domain-containing protein n=1 Tax=Jeotgalibacillus campisalis TaxID=220754 RepID=A0A0C2VQ85_9BACL|nr:sugar ABC transporter permease [Jeotgalibacillus campisalis]KIL51057.1 hypothetical protein KR50_09380 [Jeotgalibacillus campisalis]
MLQHNEQLNDPGVHEKVKKGKRNKKPKEKKERTSFKKGLQQWREVFPFLIVGLLGTACFVIYPLFKGIVMSFQEYSIMPGADSPWVGIENYARAFQDPTFGYAVRNTFLNTVVTVPINWFLGIFFAVLINMQFIKYKITFRTLYYLPIITSWIVVAFLFRYLFAAGDGGFINYILYTQLGLIDEPISWLQNQWTAMFVIWTFHIWKTVGWTVVIYLAALQGVPKSLYEAARIDGANALNLFRHVTIPMLAPITIFVVINLVMGAFNIFPQVYFITGGGPMHQTEVLQSMIFNEAFTNMNFGYSSAVGVMMGLTIFILTWTQQKKIGKQKFY